jgi:hypothetical protein
MLLTTPLLSESKLPNHNALEQKNPTTSIKGKIPSLEMTGH